MLVNPQKGQQVKIWHNKHICDSMPLRGKIGTVEIVSILFYRRIFMSNLLLNWRFGARHLQIHRGKPWVTFTVNPWWLKNKPEKWFEVML